MDLPDSPETIRSHESGRSRVVSLPCLPSCLVPSVTGRRLQSKPDGDPDCSIEGALPFAVSHMCRLGSRPRWLPRVLAPADTSNCFSLSGFCHSTRPGSPHQTKTISTSPAVNRRKFGNDLVLNLITDTCSAHTGPPLRLRSPLRSPPPTRTPRAPSCTGPARRRRGRGSCGRACAWPAS